MGPADMIWADIVATLCIGSLMAWCVYLMAVGVMMRLAAREWAEREAKANGVGPPSAAAVADKHARPRSLPNEERAWPSGSTLFAVTAMVIGVVVVGMLGGVAKP